VTDPAQLTSDQLAFPPELGRVGEVLKLTAATFSVVQTRGNDPIRGGEDDIDDPAATELLERLQNDRSQPVADRARRGLGARKKR
jgi:hypothetical protein